MFGAGGIAVEYGQSLEAAEVPVRGSYPRGLGEQGGQKGHRRSPLSVRPETQADPWARTQVMAVLHPLQ